MDVLLINAPVRSAGGHAGMTPPLGLAYIGAVLLEAGYTVAAADLNVSPMTPQELRDYLLRSRPALIGISAYTETYNSALAAARLARETLPQTRIVIGGPHVSVTYGQTAREGVFDAVEIGEGEMTMLELAGHYIRGIGTLRGIDGLAYMDGDELVVTGAREPIPDVDRLPFPARELFPLERYRLPAAVLTSRGGCPFACDFCAVNNIWKGKRRFRRPEKVMEEIEHVVSSYSFPILNFSDDSFTLNREGTLKLCSLIRERYGTMVLRWQCATRVDLVDEELIRAMHLAGCVTIQFGVESGSQRILDSIGKKIRLEQVRQSVALTRRYGIETLCSFMFPHPGDTAETMGEQAALMRELAGSGCQLSLAMTTPYPGTKYYERMDQLGLKLLTDDWDDFDCQHLIISTKNFSEDELRACLEELVSEVGLYGSLR